jgi:hypothetical protein
MAAPLAAGLGGMGAAPLALQQALVRLLMPLQAGPGNVKLEELTVRTRTSILTQPFLLAQTPL